MTVNDSKFCHICQQKLPILNFNSKRKECKSCERGTKLLYRYGITQIEYNEIYFKQNGSCVICLKHSDQVGTLVVDHDHKHCSKKRGCKECIRGLLCHDCNTSLGKFEDDVDRIIRAANYLQSFIN